MVSFFENSHIYSLLELFRAHLTPLRAVTKLGKRAYENPYNPLSYTEYGRTVAASLEILERLTRHYQRPEWGILHAKVEGKTVDVEKITVIEKTFCNLLHFKKKGDFKHPKLLIVAPMSGHYATLLRGTVEGTLPYYDVYITEWINARDIPLSKGKFDLDDYINYVIQFLEKLGPDVHVMAVCQPSVPVLAAVSIMSSQDNPNVPRSMVLIGGPIDTRHSPTEVNEVATERSMYWFATNVISRVPPNYRGFMRRVYPGFIQLSGFMTMNLNRHIEQYVKLFNHLVEGDGESAAAHKKFYNEYLSVMDLPAEFYLQTIKTVFKDHALPNGTMMSRGRKIDPSVIKETALLAIEGERDDISGKGQTEAALRLCSSIPKDRKQYIFQKEVGHYGLFNGKRFRDEIVPKIMAFTKNAEKH